MLRLKDKAEQPTNALGGPDNGEEGPAGDAARPEGKAFDAAFLESRATISRSPLEVHIIGGGRSSRSHGPGGRTSFGVQLGVST